MTAVLAVEASAGTYSVAVGQGGQILATGAQHRTDPAFRGLGVLGASVLAEAGLTVGDLGRLAVDVGPGNLNSVRAAVSNVNGLAYSLDRPIFCATSFDLMAWEYYRDRSGALLCVQKSAGGQVYLGLFDGPGPPRRLSYGLLETSAVELTAGLWDIAVAGADLAEVGKALTGCAVTDSLIEVPRLEDLYELAATAEEPALVPMAEPVNEGSLLFHRRRRRAVSNGLAGQAPG
jgi:tRNA threonylcarbamoyladenosine biosynthesis protein TsaB